MSRQLLVGQGNKGGVMGQLGSFKPRHQDSSFVNAHCLCHSVDAGNWLKNTQTMRFSSGLGLVVITNA